MKVLSKLRNWLGGGDESQGEDAWDCCDKPVQQGDLIDMGHANSFEMDLTSCATSGTWWAAVLFVANGSSSWHRVSETDAKELLDAPAGPQRKSVLRCWVDANT